MQCYFNVKAIIVLMEREQNNNGSFLFLLCLCPTGNLTPQICCLLDPTNRKPWQEIGEGRVMVKVRDARDHLLLLF